MTKRLFLVSVLSSSAGLALSAVTQQLPTGQEASSEKVPNEDLFRIPEK